MSSTEKMSLSFEEMSFSYAGGARVFENITFDMPLSQLIWIRSPGGRGKSTLLRLLAGLLTPVSGKYLINGESIGEKSFEEFLPYRLKMGYGFDFGGLLNNKTLAENLLLPLEYHNRIERSESLSRVKSVIQQFGMQDVADQRPFSVSGSMRKLTCVIRALITHPQIVFLDDPLTGLKDENLNDLLQYVEEGFSARGLKQVFFASEKPLSAKNFATDEVLISADAFMARTVA